MAVTFIRLEKTLEKAMEVFESPLTTEFEFRGVQLLPFNQFPYVQTTANPDGIELEDWDVEVYALCGELLGDITDYFFVDRVFDDERGMPQIDWSIRDCQQDFGSQLVYLKISQLAGEDFYTNPFQLTAIDEKYTARFDYKDNDYDTMQSIQLQTYFRQKLSKDELTTYYETSTGFTVTKNLKQSTPQKWVAGLFRNELMVMFRDMLNLKHTYINLSRFNLYEAFEIPELVAQENFSESIYLIDVNSNIKYDPNYVPNPVDPNPPVLDVNVRASKGSSGYRLVFYFTTPSDYTIFLQNFSFVNFNGISSNIDSYLPIVENPNTAYARTFYTQSFVVPNQVVLNGFSLRISGDSGQINLEYTGPLNFTQSDIENGITKLISATINYL